MFMDTYASKVILPAHVLRIYKGAGSNKDVLAKAEIFYNTNKKIPPEEIKWPENF